jgi:thiol-disulfide isomerase/thioredoxin
MQHLIIKSISALALCLLSFGTASAQSLWSGVATYSNWMVGGGSASTYTSYYRGMDVMTDMPQSKMKTLYLAKEKTLYSVMGMMGKPIVSSRSFDPDTMEVPLFDVASEMETIAGHNCVRVSYESGNAMVSEHSTVWLDTSYRIPFHYSLDDDIPYGLPVRTETRMKMKGMEVETVSELVSVVEGEVDDAIFAVPSTEGAVTMSVDADGNPVLSGDTAGLFAPVHSDVLTEVDSVGFRTAIASGKTVCMFTAVWCGPCRLMYPRLEAVAKRIGKDYRFLKIDIDHCPTIAREYGCLTIPVVILFEKGKELRRITSAVHSEEDIYRFIAGK